MSWSGFKMPVSLKNDIEEAVTIINFYYLPLKYMS